MAASFLPHVACRGLPYERSLAADKQYLCKRLDDLVLHHQGLHV
jgi:hypothetical protein